jgi:hypothetical protein
VSNAVARALVAFYKESFTPARSLSSQKTATLSYASVARQSGNDNIRAPKGPVALKTGPIKPIQVSREDHRVLVTLPSASLLGAREESYLLRRRLVEKVNGLTMAKILAITPTMTGWALFPSDLVTRDLLLAEPNQAAVLKALGGYKVSAPEVWFDYVVPLIPAAFYGISGEVLVTQDLMLEEAFNQTGETPVRCDMSRHGANPTTGKAS